MSQPNIILLMADQFRGDCIGINGHPDVKTPYLDTLANNGVNFENAYTACASCIPARAALFTGMSAKNHGRPGYEEGVEWNYPVTLAGELSKAGYYTQCVGKMHVHPLRNNMGFHNIDLHDGYVGHYRRHDTPHYEHQAVADDYFYWLKQQKGISADVTDTGLHCNSWAARPWIYDEELHPTNWVASRSIDFLRRRDRSKPFFLMASFVRPHPPFDAPACYFDMYNNMDLADSPVGDWADMEAYKTHGRNYADRYYITPDAELLRQAKVGYYACITHLDHQIGRILMALSEDSALDNTLVMFVSDHGELLGDHNLFRKVLPYEGSTRIPLIISPPRGANWQRGIVLPNIAELRDIMPTFLELAGVQIPDTIDGASLLDTITKNAPTREYLHGEHPVEKRSTHYIVTERDKYIWFSQTGQEQYFDLEIDPQELCDKINSPTHQQRITELRSHLIRELTGREEGYTDGEKLIVGAEPLVILAEMIKQYEKA